MHSSKILTIIIAFGLLMSPFYFIGLITSPATGAWDPYIEGESGAGPIDVVIGDADNDGQNEILTADYQDNTLSLLEWNGTDWVTTRTFAVGNHPSGVAIGDVDNDTFMDIVAANKDDDTVSIILWDDGSSDWALPFTRDVGDEPVSVHIADIDNDTGNDIITTNHGDNNSVTFLIWNDTGWNRYHPGSGPDILLDSGPRDATFGDVDGDGDTDIIVASENRGNISIIKYDSIGYYDAYPFDYPLSFYVGDKPLSVAYADADNDGTEDIVVLDNTNNNVSLWNWNEGSGTLEKTSDVGVGQLPKDMAVADVNNDGKNDIVVINQLLSTMSIVLWNTSSGTWDAPESLPVGQDPNALDVGDLSGDGINDIVSCAFADNAVSVIYYTPNRRPTFDPAQPPGNPYKIPEDTDSAIDFIDLFYHFDDYEDGPGDLNYTILSVEPATAVEAFISSDRYLGVTTTTATVHNWFGDAYITVRASDTGGKNIEGVILVEITPANDPPTYTAIGNISVIPGQPVELSITEDELFVASVTWIDIDGDNVTFSVSSSNSEININATTGDLTFLPGNDDVGLVNATLTVTDENTTRLSSDVNISFTVVNEPDAPTFSPISQKQANEGIQFTYQVSATDIDHDETLTYSLSVISKPTGASDITIDSSTGWINFTPAQTDVGTYSLEVTVTDSDSLTATGTFTLDVLNTPDPPANATILSPPDGQEIYTTDFKVNFTAAETTDPDIGHVPNEKLSYYWDFNADVDSDKDGVFDNDKNAEGLFVQYDYLTAGFGTGTYIVTLTVQDIFNKTKKSSITIKLLTPGSNGGEPVNYDENNTHRNWTDEAGDVVAILESTDAFGNTTFTITDAEPLTGYDLIDITSELIGDNLIITLNASGAIQTQGVVYTLYIVKIIHEEPEMDPDNPELYYPKIADYYPPFNFSFGDGQTPNYGIATVNGVTLEFSIPISLFNSSSIPTSFDVFATVIAKAITPGTNDTVWFYDSIGLGSSVPDKNGEIPNDPGDDSNRLLWIIILISIIIIFIIALIYFLAHRRDEDDWDEEDDEEYDEDEQEGYEYKRPTPAMGAPGGAGMFPPGGRPMPGQGTVSPMGVQPSAGPARLGKGKETPLALGTGPSVQEKPGKDTPDTGAPQLPMGPGSGTGEKPLVGSPPAHGHSPVKTQMESPLGAGRSGSETPLSGGTGASPATPVGPTPKLGPATAGTGRSAEIPLNVPSNKPAGQDKKRDLDKILDIKEKPTIAGLPKDGGMARNELVKDLKHLKDDSGPAPGAVTAPVAEVECYKCGNIIAVTSTKRPAIVKCEKCGTKSIVD